MRILQKTLLIGFLLVLSSFIRIQENNIIGIWIYYPNSNNTEEVWTKVKQFDLKKGGLEFKQNGELIVRMNAGSCGTPPITYKNHKGTWEKVSDSIFILKHEFWGGISEREVLIKKLNDHELIFDILESEIIRK